MNREQQTLNERDKKRRKRKKLFGATSILLLLLDLWLEMPVNRRWTKEILCASSDAYCIIHMAPLPSMSFSHYKIYCANRNYYDFSN